VLQTGLIEPKVDQLTRIFSDLESVMPYNVRVNSSVRIAADHVADEVVLRHIAAERRLLRCFRF